MVTALKQFFTTLSNSYLFTEAQSGKRTVHWALVVPVFLVILFGGMALGVWALRVTGIEDPGTTLDNSSTPGWLLLTSLFLPSCLLAALWVRLYEGRPVRSLGFSRPGSGRRFLKGLLIGVGMMSTIVAINWAVGGYEFDISAQPQITLSLVVAIGTLLVAFTIQAGAEELILRGWLMPIIGARYNRVAAILIPGLAFVALHGMPEGRPLYTGLSLILFTLVMTFWALRDGNIAAVAGIHTGWNWSAGQLFGLNISNSAWGKESLLLFTPQGDVAISGGTGGPEWTVATLIVLGACFCWLVRDIHLKGIYRS